MSNEIIKTRMDKIQEQWAADAIADSALKEKLREHSEKAAAQDCERWERDRQHWLNMQVDRANRIRSAKIMKYAHIIWAISLIIGIVCNILDTGRRIKAYSNK